MNTPRTPEELPGFRTDDPMHMPLFMHVDLDNIEPPPVQVVQTTEDGDNALHPARVSHS